MHALKVLSMFDGISCGLEALKEAGIPVAEYHAFEIDSTAIQISRYQHPEIIRHGDIRSINYEDFRGFDLLLCGSPCQDFSQLNYDGKGLEGDKSGLFFYGAKAVELGICKHFLFENVCGIKRHDLDIMNCLLGTTAYRTCSSLVSAQTRARYYWTDWSWELHEEKHPDATGILESGLAPRDTYTAVCTSPDSRSALLHRLIKRRIKQFKVYEAEDGEYMHGSVPTDSEYYNLIEGHRYRLSRLTATELERLQTLPDDYTKYGIRCGKVVEMGYHSRHKAIGNGWTVRVIKQALQAMK